MNDRHRNADAGHILQACIDACKDAIGHADHAAFLACGSIYTAFHDAGAAGVVDEFAAALGVRKKSRSDQGAILRALARKALGGRRQLAQQYGDALRWALQKRIASNEVVAFLKETTIRGAALEYRQTVSTARAAENHAASNAYPRRPVAVKNLNRIKDHFLSHRISYFYNDGDRDEPVLATLTVRVVAHTSTGVLEVLDATLDGARPPQGTKLPVSVPRGSVALGGNRRGNLLRLPRWRGGRTATFARRG